MAAADIEYPEFDHEYIRELLMRSLRARDGTGDTYVRRGLAYIIQVLMNFGDGVLPIRVHADRRGFDTAWPRAGRRPRTHRFRWGRCMMRSKNIIWGRAIAACATAEGGWRDKIKWDPDNSIGEELPGT